MNGCNTRADAYLSRVNTTRGRVGECRLLIRQTGWTVRSNEIGIRPRRGRTDRTTLLSGVDSRALQASLDVGSRADERNKRLFAACRSRYWLLTERRIDTRGEGGGSCAVIRVKDKATGDLHSPRPMHPVTSLSTPIPHQYGGAVIQCDATGCTQPHGNEA